MKIIAHDNCKNPMVLNATRIVIADDFDNPLAVAIQLDPNTVLIETAEEKNAVKFNELLRSLSIDKTVIVTDVKEKPVSEIRI